MLHIFLDKSLTIQQLIDECERYDHDLVISSDSDEGKDFQAIVVLRGHDTPEYIEALTLTYEKNNRYQQLSVPDTLSE